MPLENNFEKKAIRTSLNLNGEEFKVKDIIDLFKKNNIRYTLVGGDHRPNAKPFAESTPVSKPFLELEAPGNIVREILAHSEFKDKINILVEYSQN